eukprot:TRINITY_DN29604_c0_g1_i1.p1 TRINITY_DN29604_c0_g1~~TRINITY_DN29604_c0_g1_i1.p1  ORF type:complete len:312 (+),score=84.36 TRINITY_DN29604_c0_g1_i1:77-937(+)
MAVREQRAVAQSGSAPGAGEPCKIAFVGVGTINAATVRGICTLSPAPPQVQFPLRLSPRGAEKVGALAAEFGPAALQPCGSNADTVAGCDVVVLGVRPPDARAVLAEVAPHLRSGALLINLVSTLPNAEAAALLPPAARVVKVVPLPPVARHRGISIICPPNDFAYGLYSALGAAVQVEQEPQLRALQAATALMGPFYQQCLRTQQWLAKQGVPEQAAAQYVGGFFHSISHDSACPSSSGAFAALVAEQTPGGLNEQAVRRLTEAGVWDAQDKVLDCTLHRLEGRQ